MSGRDRRTPYSDDALQIENGTQPEEIHDFVLRRVQRPIEIKGLRVWNFNNHVPNKGALRSQAKEFMQDEYLIPYQKSGPWAYMASLLPESIQEAEILTYRQKDGRYEPLPNYFRHTDAETNRAIREQIQRVVDGGQER